ncbi:MAG: hypothetical protein A2X56_05080 [Nitrospirae bacterium GWC2_57_13]|jgi:hypothetical protein|nr:MAG: hypothetical protein A2072_01180 [Nitrospirae bacterium GWC1_57_7]OGW27268.1 MAG: hypothetical protein A2X56_05080 [Nitrospirae bacterium GWC2_57_13]OGW45824.1 MAG: hypothetical protein A2X57_06715 [Nitrospirae bacterium GWD2_57_8]HAR46337.1 hypothetical protein [Nitrospiraceae bacterium]HAS55389.1 hypothetical protein [Nitrospiraceae bacterium]
MNRMLVTTFAAAALLAVGCSSTFLVSKNGYGYFLESNAKSLQTMLCDSGDLQKILSDTHLAKDVKENFYRFNCTAERSGEKVKQLFTVMTPVERKELRLAFKSNGYDVNYLPC